MIQQQQYEEDIHICGQCKTRFSDVELFIQHKKFSCIARLPKQPEKTDRGGNDVDDVLSAPTSIIDNSVAELVSGPVVGQDDQHPSVPTTTINFTSTNEDIVKPCVLIMNKTHSSYQAFSSHFDTTSDVSTNEATYEGQPHFTDAEQVQAECGSHNIVQDAEGQDYVLMASAQGTSQYDSQRNLSEDLKDHGTNQPLYLESHNSQTGIQEESLTSQSTLQTENVYLLNRGLVTQNEVPQTSQLPVFISKELNQSQDTTEKNVTLQECNVDNGQNIQYTLTFENSGHSPAQGNISSEAASPKISYSFNTHQRVLNESFTKSSKPKMDLKSKQGSLVDNKKGKRPLEKKYTCPTCHYKTAYLKDLERHSRIHTGEKPYKCTLCIKTFNRSDKLALHMKYHQNDRSYKCDLCDYKAVEKSSLKKHMKVHLDERPYECQVCPYKARSSSQLQIHLRVHTGDTPYHCKECGSYFKVNSDLKRHARIHTGEKPYQCSVSGCPYRCAIKSNLRSHMKTNHSQDSQLSCDICNFQTSSKRAIFEHRKVHEVNADLTCSVCGYQCSNRSALNNHNKTHKEDRYKCNYCSYKSFQSGNVQAHMKRKHKSKVGIVRKMKADSSDLKKEVKDSTMAESSKRSSRVNIRTKCQQNYTCDQCDAAFVREDSLRCHLKQHMDSPLSTAYAVLKLQNPVINPSTSSNQTGPVNSQQVIAQTETQCELIHIHTTDQSPSSVKETSQTILHQDLGFQNQTANLGINNILAAARLSGLTSCGNSPTFKKPLDQFIFQEGADVTTSLTSVSSTIDTIEDQTITISQQPLQQDLSTVQVMQNVSLPYMRLPNGQILILTGHNSNSPIVHQSNTVTSEEATVNHGAALQTQIIAQQPTTEQQQIIQIPEISMSNTASSMSAPQSGAIPIQIILPNDSQQAIPLVSQLLNSVINRGTSEGGSGGMLGQTTLVSQNNSKEQLNDGIQNFVVQIPAQAGKDPSGGLAEGQSFVLQIPNNGNLC